jgi:prophage antirepressor-like protein
MQIKNQHWRILMSELKMFHYEGTAVRTVMKDGEPWFVLKDVCDILGIQNACDVAKRLDDDEVTRFNLGGLSGESNIVNETGLYNVILRSDKPEAKAFKRWVTHEVLPSIRKTGAYAIDTDNIPRVNAVANYIKEIRRGMENQKQEPKQIAIAVSQICNTYGVFLPDNYIKDSAYEQLMLHFRMDVSLSE